MNNLLAEIAATAREVARRGTGDDELIAVTVRREYPTSPEDLWQAVTDPERLARWFSPVTGDLREGGNFQVENNATGEIRECTPPSTFTLTWGGPTSIVTVRLAECAAGTSLELEHSVPASYAGSGAGALYVGPGWDITLLGLALWVRGETIEDPEAWENSAQAIEFNAASIDAWVAAIRASGTATEEEIAGSEAVSRAQFAPEA